MTAPRKRTDQRNLSCRECGTNLAVMALDGRRVRIASGVQMVWVADGAVSYLKCPECGVIFTFNRAQSLYITIQERGQLLH